MCGIFGYQFKSDACSEGRRAMLVGKLAELNDKRGGHSWGFGVVSPDGLKLDRGLGHMGGFASRMIGALSVFGHTRWATTGDKTVENAHPFEIGRVVGAHNGVIYNHRELSEKYQRDFAVDSMHLFAHIDAKMYDRFGEIDGYGSMEWIFKEDPHSIYLCQMFGGELSVFGIGEHGDTRGVVWSSNDDHAKEALKFAGFKHFFEYDIKRHRVYSVKDGGLLIHEQSLMLDDSTKKKGGKTWQSYSSYSGSAYNHHGYSFRDEDTAERWYGGEGYSWRDRDLGARSGDGNRAGSITAVGPDGKRETKVISLDDIYEKYKDDPAAIAALASLRGRPSDLVFPTGADMPGDAGGDGAVAAWQSDGGPVVADSDRPALRDVTTADELEAVLEARETLLDEVLAKIGCDASEIAGMDFADKESLAGEIADMGDDWRDYLANYGTSATLAKGR